MRSFIFLTLIFALSLPSFAEDFKDLAKLKPLSGKAYLLKGQEVKPGDQVEVRIDLKLMEQFFAYGDKFTLFFVAPDGVQQGELFIDPLVEFKDVVSKKVKKGLHKSGSIKTQIVLPKDLSTSVEEILVDVKYIACTEKFCLLPKILKLEIPISVGSSHTVGGNKATSNQVVEAIKNNLPLALLMVFFFGLLTSLTPCVYPLIPITLAVLGTKKERSILNSFFISLSYVVGIAVTYAILGVIAAETGSLFGSLISHPAVIVAMSLIFLAMGLSLFGLFEIQPPRAIRHRLSNAETGRGPIGAFIAGNLAGVVASPCVGPVLVTILAYIAQTQDSFKGFVLLFAFAMGFGTLFLVLGTFSQLSNRLPRSGMWMNRVKYSLGVIMIGMSVYYALPLLKKVLPEQPTQIAAQGEGVQWIKYKPGVLEGLRTEGRPTIIDFYADWCAACVEMDKHTFSVKTVINKSSEFNMVKVDGTEHFDGLNELVQQYEVFGFPTMIFLDSKGQVIDDLTLTGFEEADEFLKRMDAALGEPKT